MVQALFWGLFLVWRLLWIAGWLWSTFSLAVYLYGLGLFFVGCGDFLAATRWLVDWVLFWFLSCFATSDSCG
jgi:hypothetical protein